jgi:VWFA-related protein
LALAAAVATGMASAQPVFETALEIVNITVTARDANGGLVLDLRADELSVREDGRPQRVLLFAPAARPEEREKLVLSLGMLLDVSGSMKRESKLSQESAIRFLEAIPRAKDLLLILFANDIRISHYPSEKHQNMVERIPGSGGGSATVLYDAIALYLSASPRCRAARCSCCSRTVTTTPAASTWPR